MPSKRNVDTVEALKRRLEGSPVIISTGFTGLSVAAMTELRRRLREQGLEYRVVKNTLASIAAEEIGRPQIKEVLEGPTGLVMGRTDPVEAARFLTEYLRAQRLEMGIKGAFLEGRVLSSQDVSTLATLPPRQELMGRLVGQMAGVVARLAMALNSPARMLATVLQRSTERE